jgi:prophage antirepressor-like protein
MNAVLNFTFDGQVIRAMSDENGRVWFVGKDICKILKFTNPRKAMTDHCLEEAKFHSLIDSMGRSQEARILGPIDVMQLIRRSTLPVPDRFESWLLQEVWPALYKPAAGELSAAHQAQLDQVQSILEISNAVIKSGVSARKSLSVALDQINGHKSGVAEPFRDRIMARIAARESANEASNDQAPVGLPTDQPHNQARNLMTSMTTFIFNDQTVRAMGDADGKAWFVGKDICKILEFKDPGKAMAAHCLSETKLYPVATSGGTKEARILGPIDVMQLIRRSTLPVPDRFESWLLQEVWPALYKPAAGELSAAHQAQLDQVQSILEISNAVIKSGVSARKSLSVALDLIHAQTGIAVAPFKELLRGRNSQSEDEIKTSESVSPAKALKTGDLTGESVQAWHAFMALPAHERCLKLTWIAGTNARAAVLWQLCEHHHKKAAIGFEASAVKVSANDIVERSGQFFGCSVSGVRSTMSDMINEGLLHVLPHVDNVTRKIWLDWPVLQASLESAKFPELIFLELKWVAKNRAEMVVLHALIGAANQTISKLSPSALESQYRAMVDIDASALTRAVKSLLAAEMIEQVGASDSRCIRLVPGKVEKLLEQFYLTDFQKLLG